MVSILACHAVDQGSIPRLRGVFFQRFHGGYRFSSRPIFIHWNNHTRRAGFHDPCGFVTDTYIHTAKKLGTP